MKIEYTDGKVTDGTQNGKKGWKACYSICHKDASCLFWTYQKPQNFGNNGAQCQIFTKRENIKSNYGFYVSGSKNCTQKLEN